MPDFPPVPESYGEVRWQGRYDRRVELKPSAVGDGVRARLFVVYGKRYSNFPVDVPTAHALIDMLSRFIAIAELEDVQRQYATPGAFDKFNALLGIKEVEE